MSLFASDERIIIEEIIEATDDQEPVLSGVEATVLDERSVGTCVTVTELVDSRDRQSQRQQQHSKSNVAGTRRGVVGQTVVRSNGNGANNVCRVTSRSHMEQEKRMRREIANSNERRRMQSINAGFQSLRTLLPHHEGEKLSKAAILQQTAEYIYQLEQEKTQLLSQNCQLKRLVNQHEGGDVPIKKRKPESQGVVVSLPVHVSESGDEGLGSMSPEPLSVITVTTEGHSVVSSEVVELRRQLERERHARLHLEKQMRAIQNQLYPERFRDNQPLIAYQPHEVIEHTDNVIAQETEEAVAGLQVVSVVALPPVGSTQTVETSSPDPSSPPLSPQQAEMVVPEMVEEEMKEEEPRPNTPKLVAFAQNQVFSTIDHSEQTTPTDSFSSSSRVTYASSAADFKSSSPQYITGSPNRPFSPSPEPQRLPSVLEAAMKAEPKVEVERLPSPSNSLEDGTPQGRLYLANTSRQNLETIVEAIRHLEGDHLFSDEPAQDVPLALTNKPTSCVAQKLLSTVAASNIVNVSATISAATSAPSSSSSSSSSASLPSSSALSVSSHSSSTSATSSSSSTSPLSAASSTTSSSSASSSSSSTITASTQLATTTKQRLLHAEVNNFLQFHAQQQTQQRPGVIVVKHS